MTVIFIYCNIPWGTQWYSVWENTEFILTIYVPSYQYCFNNLLSGLCHCASFPGDDYCLHGLWNRPFLWRWQTIAPYSKWQSAKAEVVKIVSKIQNMSQECFTCRDWRYSQILSSSFQSPWPRWEKMGKNSLVTIGNWQKMTVVGLLMTINKNQSKTTLQLLINDN